jgi:membrane-associated phospholipid phosphatase
MTFVPSSPLRRRLTVSALAAIQLAAASPLRAQSTTATPPSAVLIDGRDIALLGGATAGTAALSLLDVRIARAFNDSGFHARHPGLTTAAKRTSLVTETALMLAGSTVWAIGRINRDQGTADVAFHTTASVASAAIFIQVVRGALGRSRPYVIDEVGEKHDSDPYDFEVLHGFTSYNYRSFPSMHAMASFAAATALTQEMRRRETPHRRVIGPLLYVAATAPPLARMYLDEHWASDIAMGVVLGVFSGQKVVNYSHDHPDNRLDREFLKPEWRATVVRDARGFSLSITPF